MKHYLSQNGAGIVVGFRGNKQQALEDAVLAQNIYGVGHSDELFEQIVWFSNERQFRHFLILKEYFLLFSDRLARGITNNDKKALLFSAARQARQIFKAVTRENFMARYSLDNQEYNK